jgi:hypothetical protein
MSLKVLHGGLANSIILFAGIAALWGLVAYLRGKRIASNYWGILAVGELLFLAQAAIGIILFLNNARPGRGIHILYGALTALAIPGYFALSKGRDDRIANLVYALLCLFLVGIGFRAIATAV